MKISRLSFTEPVRIDRVRMAEISARLGRARAETMIAEAMEELAVQMANVHKAYERGSFAGARAAAEKVVRVAEHIGMRSLARVAVQVTELATRRDPTALGAVVQRLGRVGEKSLIEVWELQDLSL